MYPDLFNEVLMHELAHSDDNNILEDFKLDMKSRTPGLFKFMSKHISAWTQILPLVWRSKEKKFALDVNNIIGWVMITSVAAAIFYILRWMP